MYARIRKAFWAAFTSGLGTVGIDVSQVGNVEWWTPFVVAFLTGFVTYWVPRNEPGTFTQAHVEDSND